MPSTNDHHAAAMYLIAGLRGALVTIRPDPGIFSAVADAMERGAAQSPEGDEAAVRTAARWMRALDAR